MTVSVDEFLTTNLMRALASDENAKSGLLANSIAEIMHYVTASQPYSVGAGDLISTGPINTTRCLGLGVRSFQAGPRSLTVSGGVLISSFGAQASIVGESIWRIGLFGTGFAEAIPDLAIPAADNLWYLIEARVAESPINAARDVCTNVVTRTYAPQVVQIQSLKRIVFNVKVGDAVNIPAPTAGWTPLAGFLNEAAVNLTRVIDLRQPLTGAHYARGGVLAGGLLASYDNTVLHRRIATESQIRTAAGAGGLASNRMAFDLRAIVDGVELVAHTGGTFVQMAPFSTTGALAANRFHYLYLAPGIAATFGEEFRVANYHKAVDPTLTVNSNGILILSQNAPDPGTQRNTVVLAIPAPMAGNIAIGRALCVGAFFYAAAGWTPTWCSGNEFRHQAMVMAIPFASGFNGNATHVLQFAFGDPLTQPFYPVNVARHVALQVGFSARTPTQGAAGAGGKILCTIGPPFGQVAYEVNPNEPTAGSLLCDPLIQEQWQSMDVPVGIETQGFGFPLTAGPGWIYFNLATRQSSGIPWVGAPNGQMLDVCQAGVEFGARVVGWRM